MYYFFIHVEPYQRVFLELGISSSKYNKDGLRASTSLCPTVRIGRNATVCIHDVLTMLALDGTVGFL